MLVLTENATAVIHSIVDRPELPDEAGLRIARTHAGPEGLKVSAAGGPEADDEVVEDRGARVFLESEAAAILDDKILDAAVDSDGSVKFLFAAQ